MARKKRAVRSYPAGAMFRLSVKEQEHHISRNRATRRRSSGWIRDTFMTPKATASAFVRTFTRPRKRGR